MMNNIPHHIGAGDNFIVKWGEGEKEMLLRIVSDEDPDNPRNWDNVGTMVCFHKRHKLGDQHDYTDPHDFLIRMALGADAYDDEENDPEDIPLDELLAIIRENYAILPLYLYNHSGLTLNTTGFSCPWDSGQVGYIYASKEDVLRNCTATEENWREVGEERLEHEVSTYDNYVTGRVYGYELYEIEGNEAKDLVDSRFGFYSSSTKSNGLLDCFNVLREAEVTIHKHTTEQITIL